MYSKLPDVGTTIFAVMSKMATDHNALNLSQGFPDFPISEQLIDLVNQGMKKGMNQYSPMPGLPMLREAIARKLYDTYAINCDPENEITITAGGTQALYATFTALVNPGDEVIIFDPAYDSYDPVIRINQGIPVHLKLKTPDFSIDWDEVEATINPKTKAIIINTPHNPSGAVLSNDDMIRLTKIITENDLYLISDEVYEHIIFDGLKHNSALKYPELRAKTIAIYSFGKTFHATGWKTGYMVAPSEITAELRKMHQFTVFCANTPIQYGITKYLEDGDHYSYLGDFYQAKRDEFESFMSQTALTPVPCHGTYFQLYSYEKISDLHDMEMAEWLTKEHKVATIPASVFYGDGKDIKYLRFCFAKSTETMEKAAELLCKI
jgi:methionine aminotransferase